MRDLTLVLPHFCNLGMLAEQQRIWMDYPAESRAHLHVVVVDDCSPKGQRPGPKAITATGLGSIRLFRLLKKKRWNWLACRNLGATVATTDWLLLTDMDHGLPPDTLARLLTDPLLAHCAYRFKRRTAFTTWPYPIEWDDARSKTNGTYWKPHNDSWLLTRDLFFYDDGQKFVRGYDERLSGCYGTSGEFKDRVAAIAPIVQRDDLLMRYPRETIADASTHPSVYARKNDEANDRLLERLKGERSTIKGWKPLHGLVPYEEVPLREAVPC